MSYPSGWDVVNVTGTYIGKNGVPCVGSVTFSSPQLVLRSGTIVPAADIVFTLNSSGSFSGQIPATDDPNANPVGWVYTVTEDVPGGRQGYQIVAPHTSSGIDLSTVVPVTMPMPPTFGFPYVTLAQLATQTGVTGASLIGFSQPGTGSVGRTVQSELQDRVSVLDFGAKADGVNNDGPAITLAVTFCAGIGKDLFFPAGTYRILTYVSLPSNTKLVGEIGTIIHIDPACTLGPVNIGGTNRAFYASGVSGISFRGIIFESVTTGLTQQVNVAINATSNIRVDDCTFRNFGNGSFYCQGLVMLGCSDIIVRASKFTGNSGDGLAIGNSSSNFQVSGNMVSGNADFGIAITLICNEGTITNNVILNNTSAGIGTDRCTNISITGNTLVNNAYGIRVCRFALDSNTNQYVAVSGNVVNGAGTIGISVEECTVPGGVTVTGNSVLGVSGGAGINISDSCVVTVSGNAVYSTTGASILVQSFNASYETGRVAIVGNSLTNGTYGIQQVTGPGTITTITVMGNNINNMSTALYTFLAGKANYFMDNTSYMDVSNTLNFPSGISAGSATAGGGTAIPATTKGFLVMFLGGTQIKVPYYNP